MMVSGDLTAKYTYNYDEATGRLTSRTIRLNDDSDYERTEYFVYGKQGRLQENGSVAYKTTYSYDTLDRLNRKTQVVNGVERQKLEYTYDTGTNNAYQSNRVKTIKNLTKNSTQTYTYNDYGYINSYQNEGKTRRYIYDGAGRLTSDGTYAYTYDTYNNITKKVGAGKTYFRSPLMGQPILASWQRI